jgi:hypothetical protein
MSQTLLSAQQHSASQTSPSEQQHTASQTSPSEQQHAYIPTITFSIPTHVYQKQWFRHTNTSASQTLVSERQYMCITNFPAVEANVFLAS